MMTRAPFRFLALAVALAAAPAASVAQTDCHAIGEQVAAEQGGQLARAVPGERDGRKVCIVVVLQAGGQGERPRRTEIVVPAE